MPDPAVTLKIKRFRRRFGITAPRVTIRTHFGWQWYAAGVIGLIVVVATVVWWLAQRDEVVMMRTELEMQRQRIAEMDSELGKLRAQAGTEQSVVQMERTTQQQLSTRLKALEQENVALKEDIALFERLVPADGAEATLRIERLNVVSTGEGGRYRYRLLVGFQPSKQEKEFKGRLQLSVMALQGGKEINIVLPKEGDAVSDYAVELRHFLRKEGAFVLPPGSRLKSVEARLLQGGNIKAKQSANF